MSHTPSAAELRAATPRERLDWWYATDAEIERLLQIDIAARADIDKARAGGAGAPSEALAKARQFEAAAAALVHVDEALRRFDVWTDFHFLVERLLLEKVHLLIKTGKLHEGLRVKEDADAVHEANATAVEVRRK